MAPPAGEKPYRVYRGGRVKGKVPTLPPPSRDPRRDGDGGDRYRGPGPRASERPRREWSWRRRISLGLAALFGLVLVWAVASYLAVRSGVKEANERLPDAARAALVPTDGMLLTTPSVILLLGTDYAPNRPRAGFQRSDSIMLLRFDPDRHRLAYLSIPRDMRVPDIPGHGPDKINVAYQIGGARLALQTVQRFTGLPVNHVIIVDFRNFKELVDAVGGIEVDVPRPILSNPFDCPYTALECERWPGWRFGAGKQHMDGRRATVYARIRRNQLNAGESDVTRAQRQQQVLEALTDRMTSVTTFAKLPFIGDELVQPLSTDLSTNELLQLGWLKFRAGTTLHCRLGGNADGGYITPSEDNPPVMLMFTGRSAPQPPPPSGDTYPPGCLVGKSFAAAG